MLAAGLLRRGLRKHRHFGVGLQRRPLLVPVGRLLVGVRQRQHARSRPNSGPAICRPIGSPSLENPHGMEITGNP